MFGKTHSKETKVMMSITRGQPIYFYTSDGDLAYEFSSLNSAAIHFNTARATLLRYITSQKPFKGQWLLSLSPSGSSIFSLSSSTLDRVDLKKHSEEAKAKMSVTRGSTIYVYNYKDMSLQNTFTSGRAAAKFFNTFHGSILYYAKHNNLFQDNFILSLKPLELGFQPPLEVKQQGPKGTTIFLYDSNTLSLINTFSSIAKAMKYFNSNDFTILKYASNNFIFRKKFILSLILLEPGFQPIKKEIKQKGGLVIYHYSIYPLTFIQTFNSGQEAGNFFSVHPSTILRYARNQDIFKEKFRLSLKPLINPDQKE
jgi:hypothetical protein